MIKKIIIDNFMAHEHTELELGPGVTALTGPNNTGKSAIVEALRYLTTNPAPSNCIRHGAKEAKVSVELDDGTLVTWARTKRAPRYEITLPGKEEPEEPFRKMGRGVVPDEVRKLLKLDMVELETGRSIDLHVGNQRKPIFLLDHPDSDTAAFFAASTESAHLLAMQNLLKRRTQDATREKRDLEARIRSVETEMDTLDGLPNIAVQMESAENLDNKSTRLQQEIPALESLLQTQNKLAKKLEKQSISTTILKKTEQPSKLNEVEELSAMITRFTSLNRKLAEADQTNSTLSALQSLPTTHNTASLAHLFDRIHAVEIRLRSAEKSTESLTDLVEPPTMDTTSQLSELIDQLLVLEYRNKRLDRWNKVLQNIAEPPVVHDDNDLQALLYAIIDLEQQKASADTTLHVLETDLKKVRDSLEKTVEKLGKCPTCGADLNTEAFIDRGCSHDA